MDKGLNDMMDDMMGEEMKLEYKKQDLFLNIVAMATFIGLNSDDYTVSMNSNVGGMDIILGVGNDPLNLGKRLIMCNSNDLESMVMMGSYLMDIKMGMICGEYEGGVGMIN